MRRSLVLFILIILIITICSCNKSEHTRSQALPDGYTDEIMSGGTGSEDVNIKSLSVQSHGAVTELHIQFASGSELTLSGETEISAVPKYTVQCASQEILLYVENVTYTNFLRNSDTRETDQLCGTFFDEIQNTVVFQFRNNVVYNVRENGSELVISAVTATNAHSTDDYAYFVTANMYEYEKAGIWQRDERLSPTLTRDGSVIFISAPFEKRSDASVLYDELCKDYAEFCSAFTVIAKYYNELPIHDQSADFALSYSYKPAYEAKSDVLIADGFIIAETNAGIMYEKFISTDDSVHSEIYIRSNGVSVPFTKFTFESIEKASCSPDGKRLAVLENAQSGSHLYIFDMATGELLYDLSDSGFGKRISTFVWNELGTALYAISGTEQIAVHMYDFTVKDESKRHSIIYSDNVDEGCLELYNGLLYFIASEDKSSSVISVSPEMGMHKFFCEGSLFEFSDTYAAVSTAGTVSESSASDLYIINMKTGESDSITQDFPVYDFFWSEDGNSLYYVENKLSREDTADSSDTVQSENTRVKIHRYDTNTKKSVLVCELKSYNRLAATDKGLTVMYLESTDTSVLFAATYIIR